MVMSKDTLKINVSTILSGNAQARKALNNIIENTVDLYCKACKIKKSECEYYIVPEVKLVIRNRKHKPNKELELDF